MRHNIVLKSSKADVQGFPWGRLYWYANSKIGNSKTMTIGKCVIKPGRQNPRHSHPNCSEILVVIKGKIKHTFGKNGNVLMKEGDTISIPPKVPHYAINVGKIPAILYIAFSSAERKTVGE